MTEPGVRTMKPKWKRVGAHGQPPAGALLRRSGGDWSTHRGGVQWRDEMLWLTADEARSLLPQPDDIEPAPLPEPWRSLDDVPSRHVLIAWDDGTITQHSNVDTAAMGSYVDAVAWAPLPEHPGGAS